MAFALTVYFGSGVVFCRYNNIYLHMRVAIQFSNEFQMVSGYSYGNGFLFYPRVGRRRYLINQSNDE